MTDPTPTGRDGGSDDRAEDLDDDLDDDLAEELDDDLDDDLDDLDAGAADDPDEEPAASPELEDIDFALVAWRQQGAWLLDDVDDRFLGDVDALARGLRRLAGEGDAVGLVAVDEDFFILVRVTGGRTQVLLSDVTAADDWEIAASAVTALGLPMPGAEDESEPAGDLALLADLGMSADDLAELLDDDELYPDETLSEIARSLGFGELFDDTVGLTNA